MAKEKIKIPLVIIGAGGKMGQTLIALSNKNDSTKSELLHIVSDFTLVGLIDKNANATAGTDNIPISKNLPTDQPCAFIDFSSAGTLTELGDKIPDGSVYVLGTTALSESDKAAMKEMKERLPVIAAENMSVGITLLANLVQEAAEKLNIFWDIKISEIHHEDKKDKPSGTALLLKRAAIKGRRERKIEITSERKGDAIGTHKVSFLGRKEALHFEHEAFSRDIFAEGALRAAHWGWGKEAGLYTLNDVLGLK